jgi:uncharacterized protein (TIGR03382 family)
MRIAASAFCLAASTCLFAWPTAACTCAGDPSAETTAWGDLVFEGEILKSVLSMSEECDAVGVPTGVYTLVSVSRVWAGAVNKTVLMASGYDSCSAEYFEGDRIVVNTRRQDGILAAPGVCGPWPSAEEAVAQFGEGSPPLEGHEELPDCMTTSERETNDCSCVGVKNHSVPGSLLALLLLGSVIARRRPRPLVKG